jgi:hypothetical protein
MVPPHARGCGKAVAALLVRRAPQVRCTGKRH